MNSSSCSRTWQAEALEDGRLPEADSRDFRAHAETCAACLTALRDLDWLQQVGGRLPALKSNPLEQRRQLSELRRRAFELSVEGAGHGGWSPPVRRWFGWSLAVATALCCLVATWRWTRVAPSTQPKPLSALLAPAFEVSPAPGGRWETLEQGATVRLAARLGRIEIAVHKLVSGQRFFVTLPDGELEVKGTRFVVTTAEERTLGVVVSEGRVALRLRGQPEMMLTAGERWPVVAPASHAATSPMRSSTSQSPVGPRPVESAATQPHTASPAISEPAVATDSGLELALAAYEKGQFASAEQLFAAFVRDNPGDGRAEDATFLIALCRARGGDARGAQAAARRYLQRYPHGLRRAEAEELTR